jgi:hypothetical protein
MAPGLQGKRDETFAPVAVGHADLAESPGGEIVGQMEAPVIARATELPEGIGIHQHNAAWGIRE